MTSNSQSSRFHVLSAGIIDLYLIEIVFKGEQEAGDGLAERVLALAI